MIGLPGAKRTGQHGGGTEVGGVQLIDDPEDAMDAQARIGGDSAQQAVAGEQDAGEDLGGVM